MATMNDQKLSPELVEAGNRLLELLVEEADPAWNDVMNATLDEKLLDTNLTKMEVTLANIGRKEPIGAIPTGTGVIKEKAGLEGEFGQSVIQLLKGQDRLQQCGRGRGKCLIVLSDEPLEGVEQDEAVAAEKKEAIVIPATKDAEETDEGKGIKDLVPRDNVPQLLKAAHEEFRAMALAFDDLAREKRLGEERIEALEQQIEELKEKVSERDEQVAELEKKAMATWK